MYIIFFGIEFFMFVLVGSIIYIIGEIEGCIVKIFFVYVSVFGSENDCYLMMDFWSLYDVLFWEEYNVGGKVF